MQQAGEGALNVFKQVFVVGLGTLIGNAMTDLVGKIGSIGSSINSFLSGNQQFESFTNQFTVLLGSAEAAKQRMAELAQFGATTPFDLPGVVQADRILQGFGLESEAAAQKFGFSGAQIRTIAGDVAAGTGAKFDEIAGYIGKFSAGATGEAISRFQELGITTRAEMAQMGLTFSKSGELTSPLPEAMQVVLQLMQQKYGGLMAVQSSSFEGMASNLSDFIGNAQRTFAAPIFDVFKDSLERLLVTVGANSGDINAALTSMGSAIANALQPALMFLANTAIPAAVSAFQAFQSGVTSGGILGGIGSLISSLEDISPAFGYVGEGVEIAGRALEQAADIFSDYASQAIQWGRNIVEQFASGIASAIGAVYDAVSAVGDAVGDLMMPGSPPKFLPDIDDWGQQTMEVWGDGLAAGAGTVVDAISIVGDQAASAFSSATSAGLSQLSDLTDSGFVPMVSDFGSSIASVVTAGADAVTKAAALTGSATNDALKTTAETVTEISKTTTDKIKQTVADADSAAAEAGAKYDTRIANIKDKIALLKSQIAEAEKGSTQYERLQAQPAAAERSLTDTVSAQADAIAAAKQKAADATKKAADADEDARVRYLISQGKYTEAIAALQKELDGTTKGSAEYYKILQQIEQLQEKNASASQKLADQEKREAEARLNAEIAYLLKKGETAKAMDLLKEKLAGLEQGSVDYFKVLGQIEDLEKKAQIEAMKLAADKQKAYLGAREAQEKYLDQVGRDADLLKMLQEDLAKAGKGTKDYWEIQTDISKVTERIANAQIAYAQKTGDVAGAMKLLRDMLAGVKEGSDEYFIIQKKIAELEGKKPEDLDKSAKAARDYA
ncbi:hypothetical protein SE17_01240, partial [Kouleothrix aurantiaca]